MPIVRANVMIARAARELPHDDNRRNGHWRIRFPAITVEHSSINRRQTLRDTSIISVPPNVWATFSGRIIFLPCTKFETS